MNKSFLYKYIGILLIIALSFTFVMCGKRPSKPDKLKKGDYSYSIEHTEYELEQLIREDDIIGISACLINNQDIIWQKAYGEQEKAMHNKKALNLNNTFKGGSIAHIITMIAILKLYNDGLIDIDAPITEYLPDFSIKSRFQGENSSEQKPITIRSILVKRSGLPRDISLAYGLMNFNNEKMSIEKVVDDVQKTYTAYPTLHKYKESNVSIDILGKIVQDVSEKPFNEYVHTEILSPLGMSKTSFDAKPDITAKLATGYRKFGKDNIQAVEPHNLHNIPSGNIYTSINDLSKLLMMIFSDGDINDNETISNADAGQFIKKEIIGMMFEDKHSKPQDPQKVGFLWSLSALENGELVATYSGNTEGYSTHISFLPNKKLGIILMSNSSSLSMKASRLSRKILKIMLEAQQGSIIEEEKKENPPSLRLSEKQLKQYEGIYTFGGMTGEVNSAEGQLKFQLLNMDSIPVPVELDLTPLDKNTFQPNHWVINTFIKNKPDLKAKFIPVDYNYNPSMDIVKDKLVVLSINDDFYLTAPKLDRNDDIPAEWEKFLGEYKAITLSGEELMNMRIETLNDKFLIIEMTQITHPELKNLQSGPMPFPTFSIVLDPVNEQELLLIGGMMGMYDGETVYYDEDTKGFSFLDLVLEPIVR